MREAYKRLLTLDKATAAKLIDAVRTFIDNPPEDYPSKTLKRPANSAEERSTLAKVTGAEGTDNRW